MKKITIFVFGILAYALFLFAFLYSIGFVGNFIVPKSIDTGTETTFLQAVLVNIMLMGVFALQHSVMARPSFKEWWTTIIPKAAERSIYVMLSNLALILIFWQWRPITTVIWEVESPVLTYAIYGLFALGWLIVLLSSFMISHFHLFGLQQIYNNLKNYKPANLQFRKIFLYKVVRHPLMLGFLIAFWATPRMTAGHLLFSGVVTLYIFIAVKFLEEKDLRKELGETYAQYQKEVPMLFPFTKVRKQRPKARLPAKDKV